MHFTSPLVVGSSGRKPSFTSPLVGEVDLKGRVRGINANIKRGESGREQVFTIAAPLSTRNHSIEYPILYTPHPQQAATSPARGEVKRHYEGRSK